MNRVLRSLSAPAAEINHRNVDLIFQENDEGILLNLVNMNQSRHSQDYYVFEEVPSVSNLVIRLNKAYSSVSMPLGESFEWETSETETIIRLKELHIHSIIELT